MFITKFEPYVTRQIPIAACLNVAMILIGYGLFWTAPIIPKLQNIDQTPLDRVISDTEASWLAALIFFGSIGACVAGYLANKLGRRLCLIIGGFCYIISFIVLNVATSMTVLYIGRFLVGQSICFLYVVILIYLGEIASPNIRGILLSATSIFHSTGGFLVYCVGPYTSYTGVGYVIIAVSVVYIVLSFFLPESPLYHVIKGNEEAAKESLRKLGRTKDMDAEVKKMMEQTQETQDVAYLWKELFTEKVNRRALCVTVPLFILQQSSGIMACIFFATTIFEYAGSSIAPHIATIIIGATSLISSIFSPAFIERYGRRILLVISTAGCCVSMTVLGLYFYLDHIGNTAVKWLGWLPLVCFVAGLFFFGLGLNIIPNTLAGEMFGAKVRGLGSSVSLCSGWVFGFITTTVFGYIVVGIGIYASFWIFAVCDAIGLIFVVLFVPETKGKTLVEIGKMMEA